MFTVPVVIMPALWAVAMTGASAVAGGSVLVTVAPAVVMRPFRSKRSFHATGTPSSGLAGSPIRNRKREACASAIALSRVVSM